MTRQHLKWRLAALAAGALPALAFPAPGLWWLAYGAVVPLLLLVRAAGTPRQAALLAWCGGTGFMLAVHHWLLPSLHVFILLIGALLGALWAPWGWLAHRLLRGEPGLARAAAAVVLVPSGWLLVELARSWEYLGGPWGLMGASQWQVPAALKLASLGGVWLVGFLVLAVNTLLVLAASGRRARTVSAVALAAGAVTVSSAWLWAPRPGDAGTSRIAVVQPGVVRGYEARFDRSEELTRELAGRDLDLIVWGESSVGADLTDHPDFRRRLGALAQQTDAEILVNVDARRSDQPGIYKSSVLIGPDGDVRGRYDKQRLVPFGEYVPARDLLGWATSVGKAAGEDRRRGEEPVVMPLADGLKTGPLVCFESAFPDMSRHLAANGTDLLIAQSATSTFQDSWAPQQHASLAALRAAETWRPMVHATLTGVSAAYGPDGSKAGAWLGTDASAATVYDVPRGSGTSPYVRYGDWPLGVALGSIALYCAAEGLRAFRRRTVPGPTVRPARTAHE
ncbi:apolipoprotein N-acyltransferase [Streptomyces sp. A7024]|uniref:Apolipoprotein N-acyltransferase n=1 Tax=Streptomyces coryli TaxID=1128680 RepID=A0A6G4UDK7_9ACTN|nr:apolipoprotein N-acyltransferase [Streptomyces coryli]NGN69281.1 apolipoprotein N-acyltransferase [Streptomyces coryli]